MAKTLATTIRFQIACDYVNGLDLSNVTDKLDQDWGFSLTTGTGDDKADLLFHDTRSLTATSEDLDIVGTLTDAFGDTLSMVVVKGLMVKNNNTTNGEDLLVGGAAANGFISWVGDATDKVRIRADGIMALFAPQDGYAATAGTADALKVDAGANTVSYSIILIGASA